MRIRHIPIAVAALALVAVPAAATASTHAAPKVRLAVYFERGGQLWQSSRMVSQTSAVATAAVTAALNGPNAAERAAGVTSQVPAGTHLRGISIAGGTATVDVGRRFAAAGDRHSVRMRLAQLVFTAAQFATLDRVRLEVAGRVVHAIAGAPVPRPATRVRFHRLLPAILVARPAIGERLATTVGTLVVFDTGGTVAHPHIVRMPVHLSAG